LKSEAALVSTEMPRPEISPIKADPEIKKEPKESEVPPVEPKTEGEEVKPKVEGGEGSEVKTEPAKGKRWRQRCL